MELIKPMDDITKSHSHGINPNDITLKSMIRENLNKLVQGNYQTILEELKSLNYTCENHFALLASEIIMKSMSDPLACKGIETKQGQKSPSEMYVEIAREFSNFMIKNNETVIKFKTVLLSECRLHFDKFTDKNEKMDHNNPMKVPNYKGFMNMMGLLYNIGLIPHTIIDKCFNKISSLVLDTSLSSEECDNYYSGYERLMNRILTRFEKDLPSSKDEKSNKDNNVVKEFKDIKEIIKKYNDVVLKVCPDDKDKDKTTKTIRKYSGMVHHQNIVRFEKLQSN